MKKSLLCFLVPILMSFFLVLSCSSGPDFVLPQWDLDIQSLEGPSALRWAAQISQYIDTLDSRVFTLAEIARSYSILGDQTYAQFFADLALKESEISTNELLVAELKVEIAKLYFEFGDMDRGVDLLREAFEEGIQSGSELDRRFFIENIITTSFDHGSSTIPILRRAVQAIYILDDLDLRVALLLSTAREYQEQETGQRANILIQQSIPAASSIDNPWGKAEAFSRIAQRFLSDGNETSSEQFAQRSFDQLNSIEVLQLGYDDSLILQRTARNLAELGQSNQAFEIISKLSDSRIRIAALIDIAEVLLNKGSFIQANEFLDEAFTSLELLNDPIETGKNLIRVASIYKELNDLFNAELFLNASLPFLDEIDDSFVSTVLFEEASKTALGLKLYEESIQLAMRVSDDFQQAKLYEEIALQIPSEESNPQFYNLEDFFPAPLVQQSLWQERQYELAKDDLRYQLIYNSQSIAKSLGSIQDTILQDSITFYLALEQDLGITDSLSNMSTPYVITRSLINLSLHDYESNNIDPIMKELEARIIENLTR